MVFIFTVTFYVKLCRNITKPIRLTFKFLLETVILLCIQGPAGKPESF
jgi:hypothetical protein